MRKVLRILTASAGIISVVSAVVLGCVYLEDVVERINTMRGKNKIGN